MVVQVANIFPIIYLPIGLHFANVLVNSEKFDFLERSLKTDAPCMQVQVEIIYNITIIIIDCSLKVQRLKNIF